METVIGTIKAPVARTLRDERLKDALAFYTPEAISEMFERELRLRGWKNLVSPYFAANKSRSNTNSRSTLMDFVKNRLGVEILFNGPSSKICSVCAKMTIFHNLGHIDCGIEVVPVKALSLRMSSGVSYFEQFVWDLRQRGVADIDIPVLILGIDV